MRFTILFLLLSVFSSSYSQQTETIKPALWLSTQQVVGKDDNSRSANYGNASLLNFNLPLDMGSDKFQKLYKGLIRKTSSLFFVIKSESKEEMLFFTLRQGNNSIFVNNQNIRDDAEIAYHNGNPATGILISYLFNKSNLITRKNGALFFNNAAVGNKDSKDCLFELIYLSDIAGNEEKNKIESYLSLKYGISLAGDKDYVNSDGRKIWDAKENDGYNFRVTGIGRDDFFKLNQKQSGNSEKDGLYIAVANLEKSNAENEQTITDKSFVIWGDNGKSTAVKNNTTTDARTCKTIERIWKLHTTAKNQDIRLQLVLKQDQMAIGSTEGKDRIWLAIDTLNNAFNYPDAQFITAARVAGDSVFFNSSLNWKNEKSALFTFVKAPDFFTTYDYAAINCGQSGNVDFKIKAVGGVAPYQIRIYKDGFDQTIKSDTPQIQFSLPSGLYTLQANDNSNLSYTETFNIDVFDRNMILSLDPEWILDDHGAVIISPNVTSSDPAMKFEWFKDEKSLGYESKLLASVVGTYQLKATTGDGCSKSFPFSVIDKKPNNENGWKLSPNPVLSGEPFSVDFNYVEPTLITVSVYDSNGRLLNFKNVGQIKNYSYSDSLLLSGTYLIVCSINGQNQTTKLIVR